MLCLLLAAALCPAALALADAPYITTYVDGEGRRVVIQPIYVPGSFIEQSFVEPVDVFVTGVDHVFVVDRKGNAVHEFNARYEPVRVYGTAEGEGQLSAPEGVFVSAAGEVYVADSGNSRIAVFTPEGELARQYVKPEAAGLDSSYIFAPSKLAVDNRGVMYIAVKGSGLGLLRMGQDGAFRGFFGANKANPSLLNWMKRLILNQEQLDKEVANKPRPIMNVGLDNYGFLLTVSQGQDRSGNLRQLNAGGVDLLGSRSLLFSDMLADAAIDRAGFLYGVEQQQGRLVVYSPAGEALFAFGGLQTSAQEKGRFIYPTSLGVNSRDELIVADSGMGTVQFFSRTSFGESALKAASMYYKGRYAESRAYWETLATANEMFDLTYQGLGKLALMDGQYSLAMDHFRQAKDVKGYSEAFWNVRLDWMRSYAVAAGLAAAVALIAWRLLSRRTVAVLGRLPWPPGISRYGRELGEALRIWYKPYDGYYRLKERRVPYAVLLTIVLLAIMARLFHSYGTGFLFDTTEPGKKNAWMELGIILVPWLSWVAASYLVCSVRGGEGRFREVVQGCAYALIPYIAFTVILVPLSNLVVLEESIVYTALFQIMLIVVAAHFFIMLQVIHNFDFIEALKNAALSLFTVFLLWFFLTIVGGLTFNLYDFFYQIYREVT
ncbi:hypothetical protein PA598K_00009 [Paenibacillus sp. 598K]|nr:hypothetical protein PA598K_00009 [Paenibacillus sp. 598K]